MFTTLANKMSHKWQKCGTCNYIHNFFWLQFFFFYLVLKTRTLPPPKYTAWLAFMLPNACYLMLNVMESCRYWYATISITWAWGHTSMLYFSTVLLKGSTTCQQIRMQRSISSIPPTIPSSFWSLMIWRDTKRKKKKEEVGRFPWATDRPSTALFL